MQYESDFIIEPLKKRSHGHRATVKPRPNTVNVMETKRQFKLSPELREYFRVCKQRERARAKEKSEDKQP